jgi:HlyD family secretion protein
MNERMSIKMKRLVCGLLIALMSLVLTSCQELAQRPALLPALQDGPASTTGSLVATGTIQSDEVRIASEMGGRIAEVKAQAGQEVAAGDVLVTLDSTPLLTQLAEAEAAVASAEAELAVVQAGPRPEQVTAARAALQLAAAERDGAKAAWDNALEAVENPQEINARIVDARTRVELAAQNVELAEAQIAQEELLRNQREEGSVERQIADLQLRAAQEALAAAQAEQKAAQTLLSWLYTIHNEPLNLIAQANVAEGQYQMAEAAVQVAEAQLEDLLDGPTPEEIAAAEAEVRLAEAQADVLRATQAKFTITSPIDGLVLDQVLYAGEVAAPAATILSVSDLQALTLVVYVPENRIGEVMLGQAVEVSVDSLAGERFEGEVTRIGSEPEFTPRNVATVEERLNTYFVVEIALSNSEGRLKPGMPADATFLLPESAAVSSEAATATTAPGP